MSDSFTDTFVAYAKETTACPEELLRWAAILGLSAAIGSDVYYLYGDGRLTANIWLILIGSSSVHKSTALDLIEGLLDVHGLRLSYPNGWSEEKLVDIIAAQPQGLFLYDEVQSFFTNCGKSYNAGVMSFLTSLFAKGSYRRQLQNKRIDIQEAYVCFGGASTPEWLTQGIKDKETAILSGFLPRFLLVNANGAKPESKPWYTPVDHIKKLALANALLHVSKFSGPMDYSEETRPLYETWYRAFEERAEQRDVALGPFLNKLKAPYIHKIAMLAAIDNGTFPVINPSSFSVAVEWMNALEKSVCGLMESLVDSRWDKDRKKIMGYCQEKMVCRREQLAEAARVHGENLTRHLSGLEADGKIKLMTQKGVTKSAILIEWVGD